MYQFSLSVKTLVNNHLSLPVCFGNICQQPLASSPFASGAAGDVNEYRVYLSVYGRFSQHLQTTTHLFSLLARSPVIRMFTRHGVSRFKLTGPSHIKEFEVHGKRRRIIIVSNQIACRIKIP